MWIKKIISLFFRCTAFTTLLFSLNSPQALAADNQSTYRPNLTVLTDDPAFEAYLRNLKREAANATNQNAKPPFNSQTAAKSMRVIRVSPDTDMPAATSNSTQRFIFTRIPSNPNLAPTNETTRTSQIEQLRQRASGSNAQ